MIVKTMSQEGEQNVDHSQILYSLRKRIAEIEGNYEGLVEYLIQRLVEAEKRINELENNPNSDVKLQ